MGRFRAICLVALGALCALAVAAPALGSGGGGLPQPSRAQTKMISALVDRYVKDVVLRENLVEGWTISGPQMRGGVSRKAFVAGHVPVQRLPLVGHDWAHAWYATCHGYSTCGVPGEWGLSVSFHIGHGENAQVWDEEMTIDRIHGKWVVNGLYTQAIFRLGRSHHGSCANSKCKVTGPGDFSAGPGGGGGGGGGGGSDLTGQGPLGNGGLLYVLAGVAGIPLTALLGYIVYGRVRDRRAWAEYVANSNRA